LANCIIFLCEPPFVEATKRCFALKANVATVYFKCFGGTSQVFYIDVAKVD
jgi:hypothetical protein